MMNKTLVLIYGPIVRFALTVYLLAQSSMAHAAATACDKGVKVSQALATTGCIGDENTNPIFALLSILIRIFSGFIGLILILVVAVSGLQYVTSGGSSDGVKEAKDRLKAAITGLILFVLMFGILQAILPPDVKIFRSS